MISVGNWDKQYVYNPISKVNPVGDYVRVISGADQTAINWRSQNGTEGSVTFDAGEQTALSLLTG